MSGFGTVDRLGLLGGGQGCVVRGRGCVLDDTLSTQKRLINCCNKEMINFMKYMA